MKLSTGGGVVELGTIKMKSIILDNAYKLRIGNIIIKHLLPILFIQMFALFIFCVFLSGCELITKTNNDLPIFDAQRAYDDIIFQ